MDGRVSGKRLRLETILMIDERKYQSTSRFKVQRDRPQRLWKKKKKKKNSNYVKLITGDCEREKLKHNLIDLSMRRYIWTETKEDDIHYWF